MRLIGVIVIALIPGVASASEWPAEVATRLTNTFTPYVQNLSSLRFTSDLKGYLRLRYFDEDGQTHYVGYGPSGTEYLSDILLNSSDITIFYEISGDGQKALYCIDIASPDRPYRYTCQLYLEDRGLPETFIQPDGSSVVFAYANAYNGTSDIELNYDGSLVVAGNYCCDDGFYGRVQAWKKQPNGDYRMVLSHLREFPNAEPYSLPIVGGSMAVSDRWAATVLDPRYDDTSSAIIYLYDLSGSLETPLDNPSEQIPLPVEIYGSPFSGEALSFNRSGTHLSVGLSPASDNAQAPAPNGAVAVFENVNGTWSRKGQLIQGGTLLDGLGFSYRFGLVGIADSGNTLAIVASVECYGPDDEPIDPCSSGLLTIWDFDGDAQSWVPRLGEGMPAMLPRIGGGEGGGHQPVEVIFHEEMDTVGIAVNGPIQDYLLTVSEAVSSGLPIWLLYEATQ